MKKIKSVGFGLLATSSFFVSAFSPMDNNKSVPSQSYNQGSQAQRAPGAPLKDCNDVELMENEDEQEMYNTYGYTRGDIYYIYRYKFDSNTMANLEGKVSRVLRVKYPDGDCYLVLIISTNSGNYLVNVGQVSYLDENRFTLEEGQTVQITGSKIRLNGRYIVIATKITRDGESVDLRNDQGQANWQKGMIGMMKNNNVTAPAPEKAPQFPTQKQLNSNTGSSFKPYSNN